MKSLGFPPVRRRRSQPLSGLTGLGPRRGPEIGSGLPSMNNWKRKLEKTMKILKVLVLKDHVPAQGTPKEAIREQNLQFLALFSLWKSQHIIYHSSLKF